MTLALLVLILVGVLFLVTRSVRQCVRDWREADIRLKVYLATVNELVCKPTPQAEDFIVKTARVISTGQRTCDK